MHSVYSMKTMTIWTHNLGELEFLMAILALISTNLNSSKLLLSKHPKPALPPQSKAFRSDVLLHLTRPRI
jgi:hypothetical protein